MMKNKKGESGIGTLILFIAMILVAAIAAGVLIQTSMNLQSRALSTGSRAQSQVSTSIAINSIWSEDGSSGSNVDEFYVSVKLVPGSDTIKLEDTLVEIILNNMSRQYSEGTESATVATGTAYNFNYEIEGTGHRPGYIVPGDLVTISFTAPRNVSEDEDVRIQITPRTGSISQVLTSTPEIITTTKVNLFP